MTPERLRGILRKPPNSAARAQIVHDNGFATGHVVVSFERGEIDLGLDPTSGHPEACAAMLEAVQEHCDAEGETTKYLLQWVSEAGRPLSTFPVKRTPSPDAPKAEIVQARGGSDPFTSELLQMNLALTKAQPVAFGTIMQSYERVLKLYTEQVGILQQRNAVLEAENAAMRASMAPSPVVDEESRRIAREAWGKLKEYGPDVAQLAIAAAKRYLDLDPTPGVQ